MGSRARGDEEELFPRGGGAEGGLTPSEVRQAKLEGKRAAARLRAPDESTAAVKRKRKDRGSENAALEVDDAEFLGDDVVGLGGNLPKYVPPLRFSALRPGLKVWAVIAAVRPRELHLALPHGLTGRVAAAEASDALADALAKRAAADEAKGQEGEAEEEAEEEDDDGGVPPLTALFRPGQLVAAVVLRLVGGGGAQAGPDDDADAAPVAGGGPRQRRGVELSLRRGRVMAGVPSDALQTGLAITGEVTSVEDHGAVVALGIPGVAAFMLNADYAPEAPPALEADGEGADGDAGGGRAGGPSLRAGLLVDCVVKAAKGTARKTVSLEARGRAPQEAVLRECPGLSLSALLPGQLVSAKVTAVLPDGLLLSFLTFFTGTVDLFHLAEPAPGGDWAAHYSVNQRLKARVLFVDPATKRVGLTLRKHLVAARPPALAPLGARISEAVVRRVDRSLGVLLELPLPDSDGRLVGYAHASNLADARLEKIEKSFKAGQVVPCRVIGHRPLDGLASLTLKPSVLAREIFSHADLKPGMLLSGVIAALESFGAILELGGAGGVRALCPTSHLHESAAAAAAAAMLAGKKAKLAKLRIGATVKVRVLDVDVAARRVTVTRRKGLVGSNLPALASARDAAPGAAGHGVVTGVRDYGLFVAFYGGLKGLARASELNLAAGEKPADAFRVGDVVRCLVTGREKDSSGRLQLSLREGAGAVTGGGGGAPAGRRLADVQPGTMVSGWVVGILEAVAAGGAVEGPVLEVELRPEGATRDAAGPTGRGLLQAAHLSDNPALADALAAALPVGAPLGRLMVLNGGSGAGGVVQLTRKASLLAASSAGELPSELAALTPGAVCCGYVANVTERGVFVRFLGRATALAPAAHCAEGFVADPRECFRPGQSLRAAVLSVDRAADRATVSLKPSAVGGGSAAPAPIAALFEDFEWLERVRAQAAAAAAAGPDSTSADAPAASGAALMGPGHWSAQCPVGAVLNATVDEQRDYGLLLALPGVHADVVALAMGHQATAAGGAGEGAVAGARVRARVLDVSKSEGIVDVSLRAALLPPEAPAPKTPKKKDKAARGTGAGADADAPVALPALAPPSVKLGQILPAVVELVKEEYVVLSVTAPGAALAWPAFAAARHSNARYRDPTGSFSPGQALTATVCGLPAAESGGRLLVSVPLEGAAAGGRGSGAAAAGAARNAAGAQHGTLVSGTVTAVSVLHVEVKLTSGGRGRLHASCIGPPADGTSSDASDALFPLRRFAVGDEVQAAVLAAVREPGAGADAKTHSVLELSTWPEDLAAASDKAAHGKAPRADVAAGAPAAAHGRPLPHLETLAPGQPLAGVVAEVTADCVWVALSPWLRGRALPVDATDDLVALRASGLAGVYQLGQRVTARVLHADRAKKTCDLSLLPAAADAAAVAAGAAPAKGKKAKAAAPQPDSALALPSVGSAADVQPSVGQLRIARVARVLPGQGLSLQLSARAYGRVFLTGLSDTYRPDPLKGYREGQYVRCCVLSVGGGAGAERLDLSLRGSRGGVPPAEVAKLPPGEPQAEISSLAALAPGQLVWGYVKACTPKGCFVTLGRGIDGRVMLSELAEGFVADPPAEFPAGRLVRGRVTAVDHAAGRVEMSLRAESGPSRGGAPGVTLADLHEGQQVTGSIKRVETYGVFVALDGPGPTGMAHISEVSDKFVKDLQRKLKVGARVRAKVLKIELSKQRLSLGLKASYFEDGEGALLEEEGAGAGAADAFGDAAGSSGAVAAEMDLEEDDEEEEEGSEEEEAESGEEESGDDDDDDAGGSDQDDGDAMDEDEDEDESEEEDDDEPAVLARKRSKRAPMGLAAVTALDINAGFEWGDDQLAAAGGAGAGDDDEGAGAAKGAGAVAKSKRDKAKAKLAAEAALRAHEAARARAVAEGSAPDTPADFERLLLGSPNSSYLWIQYMAKQLEAGQTAAARAVAERALEAISLREEGERLNVWVAYLNLETLAAAGDEAAREAAVLPLFQRACQRSDPKKLHLALAGIYERAGAMPLAEKVLHAATKKFSGSCKVWLRLLAHHLRRGEASGGGASAGGVAEAARKSMDRALRALPQRKHIKAISRGALLEFRSGEPERGRALLEGVLLHYPKRTDLWSAYIDQEVRLGEPARVRLLLDRATALPLGAHKAKFLFKKALEYEAKHGDAASVQRVKDRARAYVESKLGGS